jgi:hypothetical protein
MFNHPYICFSTNDNLGDKDLLSWFKSVIDFGPPGIVSAVQLQPDGNPQRFYHRKINGTNCYCAALARDLEGDEANKIAQAANKYIPECDFEISWSQTPKNNNTYEVVQHDLLKAIALEAAKRNHSKWLNKKINEGWRFGQNFNSRDKISPMCKEWDALSEKYQAAEYHRMTSLLEVLNDMNLSLMGKKSS